MKMAHQRFNARFMADILLAKKLSFLGLHQNPYPHEYTYIGVVEGCQQCEKIKMLNEIAMETHNPFIIDTILGKFPSHRGHSAYNRDQDGNRVLTTDTDMRTSGRARAGK